MKPYYEDTASGITIYHGDCREVDAWLTADVLVTDPPYGIGVKANYASRQRTALARCNDYPDIAGDDEPFDPTWLIDLGKPTILFGANHYEGLPRSASWFVWDKLDGLASDRAIGFNDQADVELVWTNIGGPARIIRHRWMGAMKAGPEASDRRVHPTQKPVSVMSRLISLCPPGVVADPFMGSGSTLVAAKELGRRAIGVELEERYCEVAAKRLAQGVLDFGAAS